MTLITAASTWATASRPSTGWKRTGVWKTTSGASCSTIAAWSAASTAARNGWLATGRRYLLRMEHVQVVVFDGFDELDAIAPYEILAAAGFAVELVTLDGPRSVTTAHGMSVNPHAALAGAPDLLVVPGGGWVSSAPNGAWAEVQDGRLPAAVAERHAAGSVVAGVCSR